MRLFGTDGIRGMPGRYPFTREALRGIAAAAARVLRSSPKSNGERPLVAQARDTRGSGPWISRCLQEGFFESGLSVLDLGVLPTPGLAYLAPRRGACFAAMVSASHNPAEFNGVKFFDGEGSKLTEAQEGAIEEAFSSPAERGGTRVRHGGRLYRDRKAEPDYIDFLRSTFPGTLDLGGFRLVLDCAHGAAFRVAPKVFRDLGAQVCALGVRPNGRNINLGCGALDTKALSREVIRRRADAGLAFDGDADRAVLVDEKGFALTGDQLLYLAARSRKAKGLLAANRIAVTTMSNFAFRSALRRLKVGWTETPVGDRYVSEAMEQEGLELGGESSGHLVFRDLSPAGDGILTGLQILAILKETGRPMSALRRSCPLCPQVLERVAVERKVPLEELPGFGRKVRLESRRLGSRGRVFVRYSGTEPALRILVEGESRSRIRRVASELVRSYRTEVKRLIKQQATSATQQQATSAIIEI